MIRRATIGDQAAVTALLEASYPSLMAGHYDPGQLSAALPLMTKANATLLKSGRFYVSVSDHGGLSGCGGWSFERPGNGEIIENLGHIRHFATHSDHTGKGIGRLLFQRCLDDARTHSVTTLECYSSLNAVGFYAAMGFLEIERTTIAMGRKTELPAMHMKLDL